MNKLSGDVDEPIDTAVFDVGCRSSRPDAFAENSFWMGITAGESFAFAVPSLIAAAQAMSNPPRRVKSAQSRGVVQTFRRATDFTGVRPGCNTHCTVPCRYRHRTKWTTASFQHREAP